jgi:hypothetical protein
MQQEEEDFPRNAHGVVQYPKGDVRRIFVLIAAIDLLRRPTITELEQYTGWNRGSINRDISKISVQFDVSIVKQDGAYRILDWGQVLRREGVKKSLTGLHDAN